MPEFTINKHITPEERGKSIFNKYFIQKCIKNKKEFHVYHIIMAREGTEAGNYYNKTFMAFVQN